MGRTFEYEIRCRDSRGDESVEHGEYQAQSETAGEAVAEIRESVEKSHGRSKIRVIVAER